jgi:hypothetical protein
MAGITSKGPQISHDFRYVDVVVRVRGSRQAFSQAGASPAYANTPSNNTQEMEKNRGKRIQILLGDQSVSYAHVSRT